MKDKRSYLWIKDLAILAFILCIKKEPLVEDPYLKFLNSQ